MKRLITTLLTCILCMSITLMAAPASPSPAIATNSDGSKLLIKVNGDEFCHWVSTEDGFTILQDTQGNYQYAVDEGGGLLKLSGIKAVNADRRSRSEAEFLKNLPPNAGYNKQTIQKIRSKSILLKSSKGSRMGGFPSTGTRKLLMILANFSDTGTSYTQANFNSYMNQVNYNGTGSFRDYYLENSYGKLTVNTTVQTWVKLNKPRSYYGPEANWSEFIYDAVLAADAAGVDFSQYDNDGDGVLDGVAVIHQGLGQEETGSTSDIWSHNYDLRYVGYNFQLDGKTVGPYTCQPEKSGSNMSSIGVMGHEFGHNLGLPDFYDTDYETSGNFIGTGSWDMMAYGTNNNYGRTPAHHNGWSKNFLGWTNVTTLSSAAKVTVRSAVTNPDLFRINTATPNEYFLIENRQKIGFDSALPGNGLIIYHVDGNYISSHTDYNDINNTSHQGLYPKAASGPINSAGCTFPGISNKTSFTDTTTPNSKSWAAANTAQPMTNIVLLGDVVTFDFMGGGTTTPTPTVNITTPVANSSIVIGTTVNVNASTTGNAISKVEFYFNNTLKATDVSAPYSYSWSTTGLNAGIANIKTVVYNTSNQSNSNNINVNLTGATGVNIISPSAGSEITIGNTVPINATVSSSNISKVEFYINNSLKNTDISSPYSYNWNTIGMPAQTTQIKVIAYNTAGQSTINTINVNLVGTASSTVLLEQNFEGIIDGWTINTTGAWDIYGTGGVNNSKCARALYIPAGEKIITTPKVVLPTNRNVNLSFFWKNNDIAKGSLGFGTFKVGEESLQTEKVVNNDYTYLEVSADGSSDWATLSTLYPAAPQTVYQQVNLNLNNYLGKAIYLRWRYYTNGSEYAYGVGVDDVKIISTKSESSSVNQDIKPEKNNLCQNYPNPFNPTTSISFVLNSTQNIKLKIYDVAGRELKELASGLYEAGNHSVNFDATNLRSGVYVYKLQTLDQTLVKRMLLVK